MMRTFREKSRLHDYMTTRSHEAGWRWNDLILHHYQYCIGTQLIPVFPVFFSSLAKNNRLEEMLVLLSRQETGVKIYDS